MSRPLNGSYNTRAQLLAELRRDDGQCCYCGELDWAQHDHVQPGYGQLAQTCAPCNQNKGRRSIEAYLVDLLIGSMRAPHETASRQAMVRHIVALFPGHVEGLIDVLSELLRIRDAGGDPGTLVDDEWTRPTGDGGVLVVIRRDLLARVLSERDRLKPWATDIDFLGELIGMGLWISKARDSADLELGAAARAFMAEALEES